MEPYPLSQLATPLVFFCLALSMRAIFSFLETSITALRLFKLSELALSAKKYTHLFAVLEKTPHRVLVTILVANNFTDVTCAALAAYMMERIFTHLGFSGGLGFTCGIAFASVVIIIFGEILPKSFAQGKGEHVFSSMLWLINGIYLTLYPLVSIFIRFSDFIKYKIGGQEALETSTHWIASEREIQFLINYIHERGLLEFEKTEMLQNIFELGRTPVKEIMVPATGIICVDVSAQINTALSLFAKYQYTRLPVYKGKQDNIIGMIHQKDIFVMLSRNEKKTLQELMRPIMFVPESVKVNQLLRKFREKQMHLAIVINEHGIVTGLITLEDIIEEIVGEISDEHEPALAKIVEYQDGWLIDASIELDDLEKFLNISFDTEHSISLAGFLAEVIQHIPQKGEHLTYKGFTFMVHKSSPRRVLQVYVTKEF